MGDQIFGKITTNRLTLKKFIEEFGRRKVDSETLIAPRPMAGQLQSRYFALVKIQMGSENFLFFTNHRNFEYLKIDEYQRQLQGIKHSWSA